MSLDRIRLGTRGSRLSLRQTELVAHRLRERAPDVALEVVVIQTAGDRAPDVPIERLEGIGFFAKELEAALLDGRCDLAMHSAKDLPTEVHRDLVLAAFLARGDPRDVLVSRDGCRLSTLPAGARVATSSVRRSAQIRHARPDLELVPIRGNIDTRLAKLDRGACDALCLAGVGLVRMGWESRIAEWLPLEVMLPAPGQGAIALEVRRGDRDLTDLLGGVDHPATRAAVVAERAFVKRLGSGCRAPAAALATAEGDVLVIEGLVASDDGRIVHRHRGSGPVPSAEHLGIAVAEHLLAHAGFSPGGGRSTGVATGTGRAAGRGGAP